MLHHEIEILYGLCLFLLGNASGVAGMAIAERWKYGKSPESPTCSCAEEGHYFITEDDRLRINRVLEAHKRMNERKQEAASDE